MAAEAVKLEAEVPKLEEPSQAEITPPAKSSSRWKTGVQVPVNMPVDASWKLFSTFSKPEDYMSDSVEVKIVEGEPDAINCVRYVKGPNLDGTEGSCWANERLLSNDNENRIQVYRLEENSFGFTNYVGTIKVSQGNDDTSGVSWSLEMDPLPGLSPPPNLATQMMADTFKMLIKNGEKLWLEKKGLTVGSAAPEPVSASA